MQEAEITIRYKTAWAAILNKLSVVLIPALIVFLVWSSVAMLSTYFSMANVSGPGLMLVAFFELLAIIFSIIIYIASSDNEIYITRDGLFFPTILSPSVSFKTRYDWNQLRGVEYKKTVDVKSQKNRLGVLTLKFKSGLPVKLNLNKIDKNNVDNLMVAIDVWGGGCDNFPALLEIRSSLKDSSAKQLSYTDMWEEELTRRFGATNFVPLEPGDKINDDKFEVVRQIAFGGMSAIYQVRDDQNKNYVLKESVVPDDGSSELKEKAALLLGQEAKILSQIDHPRIAKVFDHFVENERDYLLIEHLEGQDLRRVVKEYGAQTEDMVLDLGTQIAEIINYLHSLNPPIIHKDITPSNLVLETDNKISLIDFGAANQFLGTATGTVIGKQSYIAPEQLRGKANLKSDIYSFGCTLYFLATGEDPVPISSSDANSHLKKKISLQLNDLIIKCTQMEADERPQSIKDVLEALVSSKGSPADDV